MLSFENACMSIKSAAQIPSIPFTLTLLLFDKANDKCYIEISAITNTLKSEIILKDNYEVDFREYNSINSLLGFHSKLYTPGFH